MEPHNKAFAHNFIIFAPSGLKSSVVPSLKTIQKFNPSWIIPEPVASNLKRKVIFEVLDQYKTTNKSNKTKNPNVQKIANHQPLSDLFGLVAVTNAEKVILNQIKEKNGQITMFDEDSDNMDRQANELRNLLGKLPSLSIFIDEVHHAVSDEIKLRAVVNKWMENDTVNSVIGFSGTPYLEKVEKFEVTDKFSIGTSEITNVVYYYPLIKGIGNFLKKPTVKIADIPDSEIIIEKGVREFFDTYKDVVYYDGLTAKLGIYCGSIEKCEEVVYPLVSRILVEYGIPSSSILKFHKGNKSYPQPLDSQLQFDTLDKPISQIRVILLVQIGKEGWDCRSLTGIILSQEGDCPKNMVLQTSCRCLRQVEKDKLETALIYLNKDNAEKLNSQLEQQHHMSLKEFSSADNSKTIINRYNRVNYLKLPKVDYYQLKIRFNTLVIDNEPNIDENITKAADDAIINNIIKTTDLTMQEQSIEVSTEERGNTPAIFITWLYEIAKSSFGFINIQQLKEKSSLLKSIFDKITYFKDNSYYFSSLYDKKLVEANIRKAFYEKRDFETIEELIPDEASLLKISNFTSTIVTDRPQDYFPSQATVENIVRDDVGKFKTNDKTLQIIQLLEESGNYVLANKLKAESTSHPQKDKSFHYLPYHTDSKFEQDFLQKILALTDVEQLGLEVYYNGDRSLTEFKIKCYKFYNNKCKYIGMYTPDFLVIKRKDNQIYKAIIVETKGSIYANDEVFTDKRNFVQSEFVKQNNSKYGYDRFEYLYIEDSMRENEIINKVQKKFKNFLETNSNEICGL